MAKNTRFLSKQIISSKNKDKIYVQIIGEMLEENEDKDYIRDNSNNDKKDNEIYK